ncbi:MAG: FAD binding domain-containing protein, partial [Chloroflexota bacterium]
MTTQLRALQSYFRPATADEAVNLKREYGPRASYLGGGTDLMVHKPDDLEVLIDVRHCDISYIESSEDAYAVGGACLLRDCEEALAPAASGMLRLAIRETAPWLIRNAATLSGNIANASPAADSVPALLAADAELLLSDGSDEWVPLEQILDAPHRTKLGDRLIREIRISRRNDRKVGSFTK